jgi:DNA-binding transcriptional MerR regulator
VSITIRRIDREFSPGEAAKITGVSTALQRDWRRREIIPERESAGWTKFTLEDVIEMTVLKVFSDAGHSVQTVSDCASMAVLPTLAALGDTEGAVEVDGAELIPEEERPRLLGNGVSGADGTEILVMAKPASSNTSQTVRMRSLDNLPDWLAEIGAVSATILECSLLAVLIQHRAGGAVTRIEVRENAE